MYFDLPFVAVCTVKIILSALFGFVLGIERKSRKQFVGSRTLILISVSSTLLTIASAYLADWQAMFSTGGGDPTRIAAGLVSGIGFLGGGAIMRQGLNLKGLTSAAVIWTASALGLAIGCGLYAVSFIVLTFVVVLLLILEKFEGKIFPNDRTKEILLVFSETEIDFEAMKKIFETHKFLISDINYTDELKDGRLTIRVTVKVSKDNDFGLLMKSVSSLGNLIQFSVNN